MRRSGSVLGLLVSTLAIVASSCVESKSDSGLTMTPREFADAPWDEVVRKARGSEVGFGMWAGDEDRNRLFRSSVAARLKNGFGISLRVIPNSDTAEAVNKLLNEKGAGRLSGGSTDLLWIN